VTGYFEHIYTQLVTTSNYNTIVDVHNLQLATAHAKSSQSVTKRFLVTAPTMAIPLPPGSSPFFTDSRTELSLNSLSSEPRLAYKL
jgi:hypothetical protein